MWSDDIRLEVDPQGSVSSFIDVRATQLSLMQINYCQCTRPLHALCTDKSQRVRLSWSFEVSGACVVVWKVYANGVGRMDGTTRHTPQERKKNIFPPFFISHFCIATLTFDPPTPVLARRPCHCVRRVFFDCHAYLIPADTTLLLRYYTPESAWLIDRHVGTLSRAFVLCHVVVIHADSRV